MNDFLSGIAACGCWGATAFFLRYWRETRDRLFLLFAGAFMILSLNWVLLVVLRPGSDARHLVYMTRLAAFALIIAAIWDKNRAGGAP